MINIRPVQLFIILVVFCCFNTSILLAQQNLPNGFQQLLNKMQLDIAIPVENKFKQKRVRRHEFFRSDYVLKSRRPNVEIHYSLIPTETADHLIPQVNYTTTLANLASNEDERADIAVHQMEDLSLLEDFNADWGSLAYFHPKHQVGRYRYGKLLALFKEDRGMAYVLFLFNPGSEVTIESLSQAMRFTDLLD